MLVARSAFAAFLLPVSLLATGFLIPSAAAQRVTPPNFDALLDAFRDADGVAQADARAKAILESGVSFDALLERLRAGPAYVPQRTGRIEMPAADRYGTLDHVVEVPADYTPDRKWPVRVVLHGGVGRGRPDAGQPPRPLTNRLPGGSEIVILPRAWLEDAWWTNTGVENVLALLDRVKRVYNVDESRVHVTGISDGGTGVYYLGMRAATPWSSCLALNGQPRVLANGDTGADGELFAHNLVNCPLYMVNGGKDPLYPADSVRPLVEMFKAGGIPATFQVYPDAGHDVSWWPQERSRFEAFVSAHPRVAHPDSVSWEIGAIDRYNRFRWLVIDRLGTRASDVSLADVNRWETALVSRDLFVRDGTSGRVDVTRKGNSFDVRSHGVGQFTILLSSDVVDLSRPIAVVVNGRKVHDSIVIPSAATLLKWSARDRDRTMLYGAELQVAVP